MNTAEETLAGVIEDAIQAQSDASYRAGIDVALDFVEAVLIVEMHKAVCDAYALQVVAEVLFGIRKELQS